MSWDNVADLGVKVVQCVKEHLRAEEEWMTEVPRGFVWIAGEFPARVWSDEGIFQNSRTTYRVHSETEVVKGSGKTAEIMRVLEKEMDDTDLSSLVFDKLSGVFALHSSIYVDDENASWITPVFEQTVALQIADAHRIGHELADKVGAQPAIAAHPQKGLRESEQAHVLRAYDAVKLVGELPSRWKDVSEEWRHLGYLMDRSGATFERPSEAVLKASFHWEPEEDPCIELVIDADEGHPDLGNGLQFTLTIPMRLSEDHVARMALELNNYERREWKKSHTLGSWCNHAGKLAYRMFVPNSLYSDNVMHEIAIGMCVRADWVNDYFMEMKRAAQAR